MRFYHRRGSLSASGLHPLAGQGTPRFYTDAFCRRDGINGIVTTSDIGLAVRVIAVDWILAGMHWGLVDRPLAKVKTYVVELWRLTQLALVWRHAY